MGQVDECGCESLGNLRYLWSEKKDFDCFIKFRIFFYCIIEYSKKFCVNIFYLLFLTQILVGIPIQEFVLE